MKYLKLFEEIDYKREISLSDFNFLDKKEFLGWHVIESDKEFIIKNDDFPYFEYSVYLNIGSHGSAKEYPWGFEARRTGGLSYPHGHRGIYTIEKSGSRNIEATFKHFLYHNYDSIVKTNSKY